MKPFFCLFLVLVLVGCENDFEDTHRYSKIITQSKQYPVYLDMNEVGKIEVKDQTSLDKPFKIVKNDRYYFVGDMLKGIHVYEKNGSGVSYVCFIACRYIKDLEVAGNLLYLNNLVDLVVVDVTNPLQIAILHRQQNYFNQFTQYKKYWNLPFVEGKGIIVGSQTYELTGMVTEEQPNLDFSEYDELYSNLTTGAVPDTWFSPHPENDKPYIGMVRPGTDEIFAYGSYNSWTICAYRSGTLSVREENLWTDGLGRYSPPYYYSDAFPFRMIKKDELLYILGSGEGISNGYVDCIVPSDKYPSSYHLYFPSFKPVDVTYFPQMNAFFVLSGTSVWGAFKSSNPSSGYMGSYKDYQTPTDAAVIFRSGDKLITLGDELAIYSPSDTTMSLVKVYPDISGDCCWKEENVLAVAGSRGLSLYDITELENIQLIQ